MSPAPTCGHSIQILSSIAAKGFILNITTMTKHDQVAGYMVLKFTAQF